MQPTGPSSQEAKRLICRDCSWNAETADGENRENADRSAIDHHVTTGHSIETSNASQPTGIGTGRWKGTATAVHGRGDD